ncbi:hypothetical protein ABIE26_005296 [Pedobacter africanus]|uniref:Uncharacterized protein n=1 Tax=Pedobacter africanus TaxID=151894 RepID=A0ACC6L535_9SPHI|nr:hypothetical protein [Pedobacter africanus]MDR6786518.1 hypothetical protein [Pedobacter africanus]
MLLRDDLGFNFQMLQQIGKTTSTEAGLLYRKRYKLIRNSSIPINSYVLKKKISQHSTKTQLKAIILRLSTGEITTKALQTTRNTENEQKEQPKNAAFNSINTII